MHGCVWRGSTRYIYQGLFSKEIDLIGKLI